MSRLRGFAEGVWEFLIGEDWRIALGVAAAIALTALLADAGVGAWWALPLAVLALLCFSLRPALRAGRRR